MRLATAVASGLMQGACANHGYNVKYESYIGKIGFEMLGYRRQSSIRIESRLKLLYRYSKT